MPRPPKAPPSPAPRGRRRFALAWGLWGLCALLARPAAAQSVINNLAGPLDTNMQMQIVHPLGPQDGGTVLCRFGDDGCIPFNRAACTQNPPVPLEILFARGGGGVVAGTLGTVRPFAWLQNYPGLCYTPTVQISGNANLSTGTSIWGLSEGLGAPRGALQPLTAASAFIAGGLATNLPYDFQSGPLTMAELMRAFPDVCAEPGVQLTRYKLCVGISDNGSPSINNATNNPAGTPSGDLAAGFEFPVDTVPPPAPQVASTRAKVGRLEGSLAYDAEINDVYQLLLRHSSDANDLALVQDGNGSDCGAWQHASTQILQTASQSGAVDFEVEGENGRPIALCVQALDWVGNPSPYSAIVVDTPREESDLFAAWPEQVPLDVGFCGAGAAPDWAALLGLAAGLRRRRRRSGPWRRGAGSLLLGLLLLAGGARPAAAQFGSLSGRSLPTADHFSRLAVGLSLGLYRPVLSDDAQVAAVRRVLGDGRNYFSRPQLYQLRLDYTPWQAVGLLGPYLQLGYTQDSRPSRLCTDPANPSLAVRCTATTVLNSQVGNDRAALSILPVGAGLVYQYDGLRRSFDFPLSFTARLGLDYRFWWASVGEARAYVSGDRGRPARGGHLGASASAAVSLALDQFVRRRRPYGQDPSSRDTYLYLEYAALWGKNLLSDKPFLDLGDWTQINLGLSIGFR